MIKRKEGKVKKFVILSDEQIVILMSILPVLVMFVVYCVFLFRG